MASFLQAVQASKSELLYLVRSTDVPTGKKAWWYVLVESKARVPVFLQKVKTTGLTLTDYGAILYSGWGEEPPEEIKRKIKEQFG